MLKCLTLVSDLCLDNFFLLLFLFRLLLFIRKLKKINKQKAKENALIIKVKERTYVLIIIVIQLEKLKVIHQKMF